MFTIIIDDTLQTADFSSMSSIVNSIDRHLSNILTSIHIYKGLFIKKDESINDLKSIFKKITNEYYSTMYEYTFMSALRDKIHHSGILKKETILGSEWSKKPSPSSSDTALLHAIKDKRFSELDVKVSKSEAKRIIKKINHYDSVKEKIPDTFYLRSTIRIYVNLISIIHATIRKEKEASLNASNQVIEKYLSKSEESIRASILRIENDELVEEDNLFSYYARISGELLKAPLHLEHYYMPGEHLER